MYQKKISLIIIAIIFLFVSSFILTRKKPIEEITLEKKPLSVSVRSVEESKSVVVKHTFPAILVNDGEVKITAKSSGTITKAPGNVGTFIAKGAVLSLIDDIGTLDMNQNGFTSLQMKQSEIASQQAKKSYSLAKTIYDKTRKSSNATSLEKESAKIARDVAKLQYENALIAQTSALDNHKILSPISGFIVNKLVSVGDSVTIGQPLATIGKNTSIKAQFFVNQEERALLFYGKEVSATSSDGTSMSFFIQNIGSTADPITKRFLVEAYPKKQSTYSLLSGTILSLSVTTTLTPKDPKNILLPLSALTISQNENFIFVVENNKAKKIPVSVIAIYGENVEISSEINEKSIIIIEGNKLVSDEETITFHAE